MPRPAALELLAALIAFPTVSRDSNLALIRFVEATLAKAGIASTVIPNAEGTKANLLATVGPKDKAGIVLSGHTDVVPAAGQTWSRDPFALTRADGKLYGRGTCDMKGFVALALAAAPLLAGRRLAVPVHFAFSYDEEVGCRGVRSLLPKLAELPVAPRLCIVGEPTEMQVVVAHKGKRSFEVWVRGREAHSSLAPKGVNAIEYAAELIAHAKGIARRLQREGPFDDGFDVAHTTVHVGTVAGGTALNIVPGECRFQFEIRHLPGHDPDAIAAEIAAFARDRLEPEMRAVAPESGIAIEPAVTVPPLDLDPGADAVAFVKRLAGRNDHGKVAFGTEAGLFQTQARIPTVICGPGRIAEAHRPDEFVTVEQLDKCEAFLDRLIDEVAAP